MGRRKIAIEPIDDERNRHVTFLKRKTGLFKKAHELAVLCQVEVALIIRSPSGKLHQFGSSDVAEIIDSYAERNIVEAKTPSDFTDSGHKSGRTPARGRSVSAASPSASENESDDDKSEPSAVKAGSSITHTEPKRVPRDKDGERNLPETAAPANAMQGGQGMIYQSPMLQAPNMRQYAYGQQQQFQAQAQAQAHTIALAQAQAQAQAHLPAHTQRNTTGQSGGQGKATIMRNENPTDQESRHAEGRLTALSVASSQDGSVRPKLKVEIPMGSAPATQTNVKSEWDQVISPSGLFMGPQTAAALANGEKTPLSASLPSRYLNDILPSPSNYFGSEWNIPWSAVSQDRRGIQTPNGARVAPTMPYAGSQVPSQGNEGLKGIIGPQPGHPMYFGGTGMTPTSYAPTAMSTGNPRELHRLQTMGLPSALPGLTPGGLVAAARTVAGEIPSPLHFSAVPQKTGANDSAAEKRSSLPQGEQSEAKRIRNS